MSDTPRTDADIYHLYGMPYHVPHQLVKADFARQLERELAEAKREIESLRAFKRGVDEALNSGDGIYRP